MPAETHLDAHRAEQTQQLSGSSLASVSTFPHFPSLPPLCQHSGLRQSAAQQEGSQHSQEPEYSLSVSASRIRNQNHPNTTARPTALSSWAATETFGPNHLQCRLRTLWLSPLKVSRFKILNSSSSCQAPDCFAKKKRHKVLSLHHTPHSST